MCGIAGCVSFSSNIDSDLIQRMTDTLTHRGPDDSGLYINGKIGLGHRRLSILDLSDAGHQPMKSDSGDYVIVFNGEIYNFLHLKKSLQDLGYTFKSHSDTEVILIGFQAWNTDLFKKLNGIFSFAIWNKQAKELYIVRDRMGVKPLYFYQKCEEIFFASEIKAIRKVCPELNRIDFEALSSFLYYGNALGMDTLFKGMKSLEPGHYILVKDFKIKDCSYWKPEDIKENTIIDSEEAIIETRRLLDAAVNRQLMSDVPVGIFLSGGIDSSAITAFATKHYPNRLKTFAAAFDFDEGINELNKARFVAEFYDTDHEELFIKGNDLPNIIEEMVYHHDAPFSDAANIPLFLMGKMVKPFATVVLQGDGGDELFLGYDRYFFIKKYGSGLNRKILQILGPSFSKIKLNSLLAKRITRMLSAFGQKDDAVMIALLLTLDTIQNNTSQALSQDFNSLISKHDPFRYYRTVHDRFKHKPLLERLLFIDSQIILPNIFLEKVDRATMAASIEVRVPFLDNDLVEFAMSLPTALKCQNGEKKFLLKRALKDVVPDKILYGTKKGFGVPFGNWLKGPLFDFMNDRLHSKYIKDLGIFNYHTLDKMIQDHKNSKGNYGFQLWKLMNLSIWLENNEINVQSGE